MSDRWLRLEAHHKEVRLIGPTSSWIVFKCETPEISEHIVRELYEWKTAQREKDVPPWLRVPPMVR